MIVLAGDPVRQIAQELDAEYAGVGRCGTLFRAPTRKRCYRLIPGTELSAVQRAELRRWQDRPRRDGVVPVVSSGADGDQRPFNGRFYQVMCYETDAKHSLADVIESAGPAERVDAVAAAMRAMPGWWESLGPGLLPMPSDIVFTDDGPQLLPLPAWGAPSATELIDSPERVPHLAPTIVRGQTDVGRYEDVFTLAVAALRCTGTFTEADPGRLMHRAACAVASSGDRLGRLPVWMRQVEPVTVALDELRAFTATEVGEPDVNRLADRLTAARDAMNPVAAVRSLRDSGQPAHALALARAVLVDSPTYEVLLLAANIAYRDVGAPLEALTMLDRAVQIDPARLEAYEEQVAVIGDFWTAVWGFLADAIDDSFARRIDTTLQTAFRRLPVAMRTEHAHVMTGHLIRQGRVREANEFAYKWLYDGKTLMWWRFDLMLDYATTFVELDALEQAGRLVEVIKQGLTRVRENRSMDAAQIHAHGLRLAELEIRLHHARSGKGRA